MHAPRLLALWATLALLLTSFPTPAWAQVPISNVWRKIGFGNGPGYHAQNCCRPDGKLPATSGLIRRGISVEPCHATPRCWATMTPSRFQTPDHEPQPTLAPQPTPATPPVPPAANEPGPQSGTSWLPSTNAPAELAGPGVAPPAWSSAPTAGPTDEPADAASLRTAGPPGYSMPVAEGASPEAITGDPLASGPSLPPSSRRARGPTLPSENAAHEVAPQVTNTPELWESGPELQLPTADGSTAAAPRRRWWAPTR